MADDQQESPEQEVPEQEDPIKNLKAEMARKHSNLEAQQAETNAQLQAILAEVQRSMRAPEAPRKSAREMVFDDPDEFVKNVKEEAVREASETVTRQYQATQALQNAVVSLQQQYPEFAQEGSEASKAAIARASQLPKHMKGTPEGAKLVMMEVAAELGLVVANRRKSSSNEEPVVGRQGGSQASAPRKAGKVDEKTRQFAELLGMDLSDPKQAANLEKASSRKNWSSYE